MSQQPELYPASIGGFSIHTWRDSAGEWSWHVTVRQDTPRSTHWELAGAGVAESRYDAWSACFEALWRLVDLDDESEGRRL